MKSLMNQSWRYLAATLALNLATALLLSNASAASTDLAHGLASIGQPGPAAVKFTTKTNKQQGGVFQPGDNVIIYLTTNQRAYLTILAIASDGSVTVVLPNKLMQSCLIQPNKLYALFGEDSPVHLIIGKRQRKGKLLLYLSPTPLVLNPLEIPKDDKWLKIAPSDRRKLQILKEKLESIAQNEGFNRATVLFHGKAGRNLEIRLTEAATNLSSEAIPVGTESSIPETLTGGPGRNSPPKTNSNE